MRITKRVNFAKYLVLLSILFSFIFQ